MCCENGAVTAELTEVLDAVVRALGGTPRAGQTEMAEAVGAALAGSEHVLIQAGTGTGKSMAYLVPVLLHTTATGERAVVSTATLALQRQIVGIDAPLAAKVVREETGKTPKVALLKGWHNYVCKHKVRDRKSTRLNSSHVAISYAVFCLKKKKNQQTTARQVY